MDAVDRDDSIGGSAEGGGFKPGRVNGKNSQYRSGAARVGRHILEEITAILEQNRDKSAHRDKRVGYVTQERRTMTVNGFFSDLFHLGYKVKSVHNLKQKHLVAVFNFLEKQKQSPSTIQGKISIMRTFCEWIGKPGMVIASTAYVTDSRSVRRTMVATEDKSWDGNEINVVETLEAIRGKDPYAAIWLELCLAFGLRVRESIMLRPNVAHEVDAIWLREGTKGDRPRVVPLEEQVQRDVLERAKAMADQKTGRIGRRGKSVEQNIKRLYYIMESHKLTLAGKGVTAHGLRHQYMHHVFLKLTGENPPVKGGSLSNIDKHIYRTASQKLMERAGHVRLTIGASYYGSRRVHRHAEKINQGERADTH